MYIIDNETFSYKTLNVKDKNYFFCRPPRMVIEGDKFWCRNFLDFMTWSPLSLLSPTLHPPKGKRGMYQEF